MNKDVTKKIGIISIVLALCVGVLFLGSEHSGKNLRSESITDIIVPGACYLQSEIDTKIAEKNTLEVNKEQTLSKKNENTASIQNNDVLLNKIEKDMATAEKNILSDEELKTEKGKSDALALQRDEKIALETLSNEVDTKKGLADTDKNEYERILNSILPQKTAYEKALKQYEDKIKLDELKNTRDTLPAAPTTAQINARRNLETLGTPIINTKRPTAQQITDRQNLERKETAKSIAKNRVPATTNRNYQRLYNDYITANTQYTTALNTYNQTYAQSDFGTQLTYAQLNTAVNAYNRYTTALTTYNRTYPNNTLTLAELNTQAESYSKAQTAYQTAYNAYHSTYNTANSRALDNRTASELLTAKNTAETTYNNAAAPSLSLKKNYDTVSYPAYENALNTYTAAKTKYETTYPGSTLSSVQITAEYQQALDAYNQIVAKNDDNKNILAELLKTKITYEDMRVKLAQDQLDIDTLLTQQDTQITALNAEIIIQEENLCPTTETICTNNIDDDRDNTSDCDDNDCAGDSACRVDVVICTVEDDAFVFKRSDGSTNFSNSVVSLGGTDNQVTKYDIEYSESQLIFKADVYIDGHPVQCPPIITQNDGESGVLESCDIMKQNLQEEGEDTSSMTCTGQYSFRVEKANK